MGLLNKKRRREFGLTIEFLLSLFEGQKGLCAISKIPMTWDVSGGKIKTNISLDRIDPSRGYERDNCQLVCFIVNMMKFTLTMEEFRDWCYKVLKGKYK